MPVPDPDLPESAGELFDYWGAALLRTYARWVAVFQAARCRLPVRVEVQPGTTIAWEPRNGEFLHIQGGGVEGEVEVSRLGAKAPALPRSLDLYLAWSGQVVELYQAACRARDDMTAEMEASTQRMLEALNEVVPT